MEKEKEKAAENLVRSLEQLGGIFLQYIRDSLEEGRICGEFDDKKIMDSLKNAVNVKFKPFDANAYKRSFYDRNLSTQEAAMAVDFFYNKAGGKLIKYQIGLLEFFPPFNGGDTLEMQHKLSNWGKKIDSLSILNSERCNEGYKKKLLYMFNMLPQFSDFFTLSDTVPCCIAGGFLMEADLDEVSTFYQNPLGKKFISLDTMVAKLYQNSFSTFQKAFQNSLEKYYEKIEKAIELNNFIFNSNEKFLINILNYDISTVHYQDSLRHFWRLLVSEIEETITSLKKLKSFYGNTYFQDMAIKEFSILRNICLTRLDPGIPFCIFDLNVDGFCEYNINFWKTTKCQIQMRKKLDELWLEYLKVNEDLVGYQKKFADSFDFCLIPNDTVFNAIFNHAISVGEYAEVFRNIYLNSLEKCQYALKYFCDQQHKCGSNDDLISGEILACFSANLVTETLNKLIYCADSTLQSNLSLLTKYPSFKGDKSLFTKFTPHLNILQNIIHVRVPKLLDAIKKGDINLYVETLGSIGEVFNNLWNRAESEINDFYQRNMPKKIWR